MIDRRNWHEHPYCQKTPKGGMMKAQTNPQPLWQHPVGRSVYSDMAKNNYSNEMNRTEPNEIESNGESS
jgi:hypothetical protein